MNKLLSCLVLLVLAGCGDNDETTRAASSEPTYKLVCDSSDTRQSSTLFCVRIDTRDGDVRAVDLSRIPQSNGPTASASSAPGRYDLVCDSTNTETRADFRCVRLDRQSGDLLLVNLPKVAVVPPAS